MKKIFTIFLVVCVVMCSLGLSNVYAKITGEEYKSTINEKEFYEKLEEKNNTNSDVKRKAEDPGSNEPIGQVVTITNNVWVTARLIVQVLSISCIIFTGIRYIYAPADKKADMKKTAMYLIIGAVFIFACSTVIGFMYQVGNSVITE